MEPKESQYPEDWFKIGDKELTRAKTLLDAKDLSGTAFNIQQTIEKYLKGYLLFKGWKLRKIHDLEPLLNETVSHEASFEEFREACLKATEYYIEERYPFTVISELTEDEIKKSLIVVEKLINKIKEFVGKNDPQHQTPDSA